MRTVTTRRRKWKKEAACILMTTFKISPSREQCRELITTYTMKGLFIERTVKDIQTHYKRLVRRK
jgi:hypothetical protein